MQLSLLHKKLISLLIVSLFFGLLLRLDFLSAPKLHDEIPFWNTSLVFSESLIPELDVFRSYGELNTPLPFIIYGLLENLSGHSFTAGRLLNVMTPRVEEALSKVDPGVQTTAWAIAPGRAINYIGSIATYIVIPEFILFRLWRHPPISKQQRYTTIVIASIFLVIVIISPPLLYTRNAVNLVAGIFNNTNYEFIGAGMYYLLSLLVITRFSQPSPLSLMVLTNSLIMAKVYPWDKYLWPFVIAFWYLRATQPDNTKNQTYDGYAHQANRNSLSETTAREVEPLNNANN